MPVSFLFCSRGAVRNCADFFQCSLFGLIKYEHRDWLRQYDVSDFVDPEELASEDEVAQATAAHNHRRGHGHSHGSDAGHGHGHSHGGDGAGGGHAPACNHSHSDGSTSAGTAAGQSAGLGGKDDRGAHGQFQAHHQSSGGPTALASALQGARTVSVNRF